MQLRCQSFIALLEKHGFIRKSLLGLQVDYPERYTHLKSFYLDQEAYGLLELMVNKPGDMESQYMIWLPPVGLPKIFEFKPHYSDVEAHVFSLKTKIPMEEFQEMIDNCS